jgi:hypothetical protein
MDARERWQALQARLTAARAAVENGDRPAALSEIAAALELDKDFLAAQALRDRIVSMDESAPSAVPASAAPAPPPTMAEPEPAPPPGYAKFEQRARRRRVDRRVDAARAAIDQHRLKAAAAALDEVIDLDPNLPELAELTARFDELRRATATPHHGPWIAAAAVFAVALLGASWLQDSSPLLSRQIVAAAPLPAPLEPIVAVSEMTEPLAVAGTAGERERTTEPAPIEAAPRAPEVHASLPPDSPRLSTISLETPPPSAAADPAPAAVELATVASVSPPVPPGVDAPDDSALVKQALQRYRSAYERLDAQSAQSVWPAVNQAALARAFDGLASQSLTFDACDVRLRGEIAIATCQGSARYVTKIGSGDPHVEPRVWNFTLHKAEGDWKIDSARAER